MAIYSARRLLIFYAATLLFNNYMGSAQSPGTGAISGVVLDPANRAVSNAEVTVVNQDTHASRQVQTATEGFFRVALLAPGLYSVAVSSPGFTGSSKTEITVEPGETSSVSLSLTIAPTRTDVQVNGASDRTELEGSTLGGLVDDTAMQSLPLSSRNYTQIIGLSPGIVADLPTATALGNGTQNVASNGATPTANNVQFNGIDANNLQENSAALSQNYQVGTAIPAPDSIQEFRVQSANFDAAYGRGSGASVDLVSRSGTNQLHGSVWEFVRNNIFNANDFFSKLTAQSRADLKQNEFGASIGGPLRRNRTFLFGTYQGVTQVNGLGTAETTTLPAFTSDRSASTLGAQFCPSGHPDDSGQPATGYLTTAGGTQVSCDGSNINPVAVAVLNAKLPNGQLAIPNPQAILPPSPGTDPTDQLPLGVSTFHPPARYREDQFGVDLDQVITQRNSLSGRFFYSRGTINLPFSPNGATVPGWGTDALNRNTMFVLANTHVFNSTTVNVARFGYMRFDGLSSVENPISAQSIGVGTPTGATGASLHMPSMTLGTFLIGDGGTPAQWSVTNSFIWQDTLALTKGRHNARFGVELKRHEVDEDQPQQVDGNLMFASFPDFLVGQSASQNGSSLGFSNVGTSIAGGGIFRRDERYTDLAVFVQDDLKITQTFTLNAGLRYEIFGAPTEIHGRLTNFDPALAMQGPLPPSGTFNGFTVASNFESAIPPGVAQTPYAGYYKTPHGDISPRLGFAWQMKHSPMLVMRSGFGVYFDRHSGNVPETMLGQPPFALSQFSFGVSNGQASLQSPFAPLVPPASSFPIFSPLVPGGTPFIEGTNPNIEDGKTYEYNLNLQYSLGRGYLLQIGYVGTQSVHRPGSLEFDQTLLASPQNPVNGETTNSTSNVLARMPVQGVSPGALLTDSVFTGNFNALEASVNRRFQHGLELQAAYTWSKNLDEVNGENGSDVFELQLPTNNQLDLRNSSYGPANDDRDQRVVVSFVWATPNLTVSPSALRYALNDWRLSGIALFQAGAALSVFDSNAGSVYGLLSSQLRAQLAPGGHPSTSGSLFSRVVSGRYLDPNAFTRAPEVANGTAIADEDFGNSGVGLVRGPGQHSIDLAIERSFPVTETKSFVFRMESFNVTNTPQFGNPNTSLGYPNPLLPAVAGPGFGQILSEQGGPHPRIIQLAAKFLF